ncbi:MAG: CPBP family intramembrane metalloprotease [Spirochaetaceae bacterium]|jgi:membrane protease YdiL (CAAX protease family)|nr:CPBP family intramembrane metalloprotease [Spirochaetaceae bacterium]
MRIFAEILALYLLLFSSGMILKPYPETLAFSAEAELFRLFAYTLPGLGLIGLLLFPQKPPPKPGVNDIAACIICLPGLILLGFAVSSIAGLLGRQPPSPRPETPESLWTWTALGTACLGTGYLEESFFRLYLTQRLEEARLPRGKTVFVSTLLFACCHIYEGPWGVVNAACAGLGLSAAFAKLKAVHGLAWAHGGYNIFVFALSSLLP